MTQEQEQKLNEVYEFMRAMKSSTTIPYDVDGAFRDRLRDLVEPLSVSSKDLNSEDQAVDEGGMNTYSVMGDPDGFLQVTINNTVYYLPYFT